MLEILSDIGYVFTFIVWPQVAVLGMLATTLPGRLMAGIGGRLLGKEKPARRPASIRRAESLARGRARILAVGR